MTLNLNWKVFHGLFTGSKSVVQIKLFSLLHNQGWIPHSSASTRPPYHCILHFFITVNIHYLECPFSRTIIISNFFFGLFSTLGNSPYKYARYLEPCYLEPFRMLKDIVKNFEFECWTLNLNVLMNVYLFLFQHSNMSVKQKLKVGLTPPKKISVICFIWEPFKNYE